MPRVSWDPERPANADALEAEIERVAPGAEVKLTRAEDGAFLVRALLPLGLCTRGRDVMSREVSGVVAEVLTENDLPARVWGRRPRLS